MRDAVSFTVTGIEFTGALYLQMNGTENKFKVSTSVCLRALQQEPCIWRSLQTLPLRLAVRRFAIQKSLPQII